ncbi:MAG: sulfite exporter TauE/SafE family protein [Gammaproteobacteria bacterium]|nr:sulfite exporter TauE/SafE family protein [Gammaproteobacteria bacterium]
MEPWLILGVAMLMTGVAAGILAGLFGIGGGIVIVPVLEAALGFVGVDPAIRMHVAVGTSLATIIPTSISSARSHHKRGAVDVRIVKRWAVFVLLGALLGAWIASRVHSDVLALVFATLAMLMAVKTVFFPESRALAEEIPAGPLVPALLLFIGCASAMMGIGGGLFTVMTLTLFGVAIHRAVGTAALFGLFIALPGALGFIVAGWSDPRIPAASLGFVSLLGFVCIAPTTVLTAPLGAKIAHALSAKRLSMLFGVFLVVASIRLFYRAIA